MKYKCKNTK